uniref:Sushi domain-containing protein n=1 Tax=Calidris pygmaea TaxID=425635 RepID=A0A8C3KQN4_9CHAR
GRGLCIITWIYVYTYLNVKYCYFCFVTAHFWLSWLSPGSCPSPLRVPFAKISAEDETLNFYPVDVTVRYICRLGHENITDQLPTSTCRDNLTWSEVPKLCQRKSCGIPANPEHGKVITNEYLLGTRAEVVCNRGYRLKGASRHVFCSLRGAEVAWTQIPACQAVSCPPPPAIPDGKHNGTGTEEFLYHSVVTYTCDPGLRLVGNESLRCTTENGISGTWSGSPPECRGEPCWIITLLLRSFSCCAVN